MLKIKIIIELNKMVKQNKKFIQKAIPESHEGRFTKYCKKKGFKGVSQKCISEGQKSKNPHTVKQANFAKTLRRLPEPHHKKGMSHKKAPLT